MPATKHPSKQQVRAYLRRRARAQTPPPSLEEIRRQLGWDLLVTSTLKPAAVRS